MFRHARCDCSKEFRLGPRREATGQKTRSRSGEGVRRQNARGLARIPISHGMRLRMCLGAYCDTSRLDYLGGIYARKCARDRICAGCYDTRSVSGTSQKRWDSSQDKVG